MSKEKAVAHYTEQARLASPQVTDEQIAFEQHVKNIFPHSWELDLASDRMTGYGSLQIRLMWGAWQARSRLSASQESVPHGWLDVIAKVRKGIDTYSESSFDNSGYRNYAHVMLDAVVDGLDDLSAPPAAETSGCAKCDKYQEQACICTKAAPQEEKPVAAVNPLDYPPIELPFPKGYCTDPNGVIVPRSDAHEDYEFGYSVGYGEAWHIMNDAIKHRDAKRVSAPQEQAPADKDAEIARLNAIINTPQSGDFLRAVGIEAEHQRQRWGSDHDAGKTAADWFWLVGYLAGKALHADIAENIVKTEHHLITTASALMNWHLSLIGCAQESTENALQSQPQQVTK